MKKAVLMTLLTLILSMSCIAQMEESYLELVKREVQLRELFGQLYDMESPLEKDHLYYIIDTLFRGALEMPGSFDYEWSKLENMGKLKSDDGVVRVFSWLYMKSRNDYRYTCYLQVDQGKGKIEVFKLQPGNSPGIKSDNHKQTIEDWHGKIYYQLITTRYKKKSFYTLLGADFNTSQTTYKTAEVMAVQRGKPVFRGDQFLDRGTVRNRMIFEYSSEVAMSLSFNKELDQIVFDHLAPLHPLYYGIYQFYGPDGSYNGLRFTEGVWVLEEDVDARNIR